MFGWSRRRDSERMQDEENLQDLQDKLRYFEDLEERFRIDLDGAERARDAAMRRNDRVNVEIHAQTVTQLRTYLQSVARIKSVVIQLQHMVRFQRGMSKYGEITENLANVDQSNEVHRKLEAIHVDLEFLKGKSFDALEKIDSYFEGLQGQPTTATHNPVSRQTLRTAPEAASAAAAQERATKERSDPTLGPAASSDEENEAPSEPMKERVERLRKRLRDDSMYG